MHTRGHVTLRSLSLPYCFNVCRHPSLHGTIPLSLLFKGNRDDTTEKVVRRGGGDGEDRWPQRTEMVANGEKRERVG